MSRSSPSELIEVLAFAIILNFMCFDGFPSVMRALVTLLLKTMISWQTLLGLFT
jgi:hypothetical protein